MGAAGEAPRAGGDPGRMSGGVCVGVGWGEGAEGMPKGESGGGRPRVGRGGGSSWALAVGEGPGVALLRG